MTVVSFSKEGLAHPAPDKSLQRAVNHKVDARVLINQRVAAEFNRWAA
jgi:hypothetical protein